MNDPRRFQVFYEDDIVDAAQEEGKPVLEHQSPETYLSAYVNFYKSLLEQEETVS